MTQTTKMLLGTDTILNIPLQYYNENFTFIVNGKSFKTTRLIADLLSPNICRLHTIDPTAQTFRIDTKEKGDFSNILNLIKFENIQVPMNEISFIIEVIENLGNNSIRFHEKINQTQITCDNVFSLINRHAKYENFYSKELQDDIIFISSHFYELCATRKNELVNLPSDLLFDIVGNDMLQLNDEDQFLSFINDLYSKNPKYSVMYQYVYFSNVSSKSIKDFINIFNYEDMNHLIWAAVSLRLENENQNNILNKSNNKKEEFAKRYEKAKEFGMMFPFINNKPFSGVFNYLKMTTEDKIENEISITSSEGAYSSINCPLNVFSNEDRKYYRSFNEPNSWICFEFKKHRITPSYYTIMSANEFKDGSHPKSWVIEGSINSNAWEVLDDQKNCSYLNGRNKIYTVKINNESSKEFKYIRMRMTGQSWYNDNCLQLHSFEIFGRLV